MVELPQVRDACAPFTSRLFRRRKRFLATEPLRALVIGGFVRGLSMRDVESLCEEAGLGQVSKSTASRLCRELKERFRAFRERDLSGLRLVCRFLDAIFLPVRPSGVKEGVLCAWGITEAGERVLLDLCLGMREAEQDWLELGRSLTRRGLPAPLLVVADGAPGLVNASEQLWPEADRQRCTVHRLRNVLAKLPERERERVKAAYWRALDQADSQADGERRLRTLVGELPRRDELPLALLGGARPRHRRRQPRPLRRPRPPAHRTDRRRARTRRRRNRRGGGRRVESSPSLRRREFTALRRRHHGGALRAGATRRKPCVTTTGSILATHAPAEV